jgi:BioD-like phosphotransacetylase family protein
VCPGGIGRPIDEVALNKALFDQAGVEVVGAIINKVEPDKAAQIRDYVGRGLERLGVPLLGLLPVQKVLASPNLHQIADEISGRWLNAETLAESVRVSRVVVGAMTAKGIVEHLRPGTVIITPGDRDDILLAAISGAQLSPTDTVAGIILTNDIEPHPKLLALLAQTSIPVMLARSESFTVTSQINRMTVKTQPNDRDKIPVIKQLIQEHVDMVALLKGLEK